MDDRGEDTALDADLAVAIVGMAGRFPKARTVRELWRRLCAGEECFTTWTPDDLRAAGVDAALLAHPSYVPVKGELSDVDCFDAAFFGISPREAELTDPQHRLLLECAWEALEDAGYDPRSCPGDVGVYAGKSLDSYLLLNVLPHFRGVFDASTLQAAIGNDKDSITTLLAYHLNLTGPAITVQSSSSTSLVAVCVAAQSLLTWQCDVALAGGVAVGPPLGTGYLAEEGGISSRDGHCRAFDARSTGFVPGMGLGMVVLKRLSDALRDHDHVYAVLEGFAVNNDGRRKVGYTAPSVDAQARVVTQALRMAGISPADIGYVEAHGTGTRLGDPIEVTALNRAFSRGPVRRRSCAIGSVKTNIGHLDTAAGIAGLLKATLAVHHGQIPPSLHFETPNPAIDFDAGPFYVSTELTTWRSTEAPRRAGVTSLGMGGTNAHVVLEQAPPRPVRAGVTRGLQLLVCSARSDAALGASLERLAAALRDHTTEPLADVAFTLARGRGHFDRRAAFVARTHAEAAARAEAARTAGARLPGVRVGRAAHPSRPICFLFPGQGAQFHGMARGIYRDEPVFAAAFDELAAAFVAEIGIDLRRVLFDDEIDAGALADTALAQPLVLAVELALVKLWQSWGVRPDALIGHSLGEWTAAVVAGVFPLSSAVRLVAERGRRMAAAPRGSMLAVQLAPEEAQSFVDDELALAAVNAPHRCVLSGPTARVDALARALRSRGVTCTLLPTSHAFHAPAMTEAATGLLDVLRAVPCQAPSIPIYSTLSGRRATAAEVADIDGWRRQTLEPVRFAEAVQRAHTELGCTFLEVGPGRVLAGLTEEILGADATGRVLASLPGAGSPEEDGAAFLDAAAGLWCEGHVLDLERIFPLASHFRVPLPTYPFERTRYWLAAPSAAAAPPRSAAEPAQEARLAPAAEGRERPPLSTAWQGPKTPTEVQVKALVEDLLGITGIGVDDNVFELGGSSLLLVTLAARLREANSIDLALGDIFATPTVRGIAALVSDPPAPGEALVAALLDDLEAEES